MYVILISYKLLKTLTLKNMALDIFNFSAIIYKACNFIQRGEDTAEVMFNMARMAAVKLEKDVQASSTNSIRENKKEAVLAMLAVSSCSVLITCRQTNSILIYSLFSLNILLHKICHVCA